jgi:hypothetical protein
MSLIIKKTIDKFPRKKLSIVGCCNICHVKLFVCVCVRSFAMKKEEVEFTNNNCIKNLKKFFFLLKKIEIEMKLCLKRDKNIKWKWFYKTRGAKLLVNFVN